MKRNPNSFDETLFNNDSDFEFSDYKKNKTILKGFKPIVICILIFELCERLTFYSLTANFVPFLTKYLMVSNVAALNISLVFTGGIYIICLFCGWISDSVLGKFRTIVLSGLIYFIGAALIAVVTFDFNHLDLVALTTIEKRIFTGFALVLIAFGTGGIKTSVGPFGAEQFDKKNENLTRLFFIWLYWFVNLGSAIAFLLVTYIQQNISFFTGFLIPLCSIFVAIIIFTIPKKFYKTNPKMSNTTFFTPINIIWESISKRSKTIYKYDNLLDYARLSNGGSYQDQTINDLMIIKRIIPVLLTFIPFYISYVQMQSTYLLQGEHLFLNISTFVIPVASLNVVNAFVIIFVIPVLVILVYPIIIKCFGRPPSPLQRIGFGLFLSAVSVLMAGILEIIRKKDLRNHGGITQEVFGITYNVSSISVLTQIPQFFFVGAGEVFASATGLEFAYSQAPKSQQSMITGIFYVMMGIGSFSSSLLILLVNLSSKPWVPDNIDYGHYEYFFFLLAGIIILDVIIFYFVSRSYKYIDSEENRPLLVKYENIIGGESIVIEG